MFLPDNTELLPTLTEPWPDTFEALPTVMESQELAVALCPIAVE